MPLSMWLDNLLAYSLQIGILIAAGTLLAHLFRLRMPKVSLTYWQLLLGACLLLPFLQPWQQTVITTFTAAQVTAIPVDNPVSIVNPGTAPFTIPYSALALILCAGVLLRFLWLGVGMTRLYLLLKRARWMSRLPPAVKELRSTVGIAADVYISREVRGPVTFGLMRGTVLLPDSMTVMEEDYQRAIVCHELLHVARHDWGFMILEEIVRSLFWFHPGIWWVLRKIHLSREQVVDSEVMKITGNKKSYLESLLHMAQQGRPQALPAPLFLREHHLVERVALLVKEVRMSKPRLIISLASIAAFMVWTGQLAAGWWPLQSAPRVAASPSPQPVPDPAPAPDQSSKRGPIRVGNAVQASMLIHRVPPVFPEKAREARVQGTVMIQALIDERGVVREIKVLRGHPLLNDAAIEAVSQWRYAPTTLKGEPVAVLSNVEVFMTPGKIWVLDEQGHLIDLVSQIEGEDLLNELGSTDEPVILTPDLNTSFETIESTLRMLQAEGFENLRLKSTYKFHQGRLFYPWPHPGIEKPEIALQEDVLKEIALASGLMEEIRPEKDGSKLLLYTLYVNEVSEIVDVVRLRGPDLHEVIEELFRTPVIAPGRRGMEPVPVVFYVEIRVGQLLGQAP